MNETYYVKTEEKEHTVKIQNEEEKFYSYDGELIENPIKTLIEKTITENGEYLPASDNADGYSKVTVNTPIKTLIEKTITTNGEYLPSSDNADGYSKVTVDVQPTGGDLFSTLVEGTLTELKESDFSGITTIREGAFYRCSSLITVKTGDDVATIGAEAFSRCTGLRKVEVGHGVTFIGSKAFNANLPSNNGFYIYATTPPTLENSDAFSTGSWFIYVPTASLSAYQAATNWSAISWRLRGF